VIVSPFFLDVREVTVGAFRASGVAHLANPPALDKGDPHDLVDTPGNNCTFTAMPVGDDDLPTNCLTWAKAREHCAAVGKDLPTEAQFEYAASGMRSSTYVWGEEEPACRDAVFARALPRQPLTCAFTDIGFRFKPVASAQGERDRLLVGEKTIFDLAGNVREWTRDVFARQTEPCWKVPLLTDPECTSGTDPNKRSVRGGSWRDQSAFLRAATRHSGDAHDPVNYYFDDTGDVVGKATIGFRCARPGN